MSQNYDLIIVGAGLAGNCLALALQNIGLNIAIVEANSREQLAASTAGDRALALAAGTFNVLDKLELWQEINDKATPIKQIHISDRGHFGKTRLVAEQLQVDALGYVITARDIETHLAKKVEQAGITLFTPYRLTGLISDKNEVNVSLKCEQQSLMLTAKLLVGADGGNSTVRKLLDISQQIVDYRQSALVTTVKTELPHHNTAYERFTESGPLALLPLNKKHCAVVWTRTSEDAEALMLGSETDFLSELQNCFGYRLGELTLVAPRRCFPLTLIRAEAMSAGRALIIGNAAHQLHPVAGQGFNLGLRDVTELAKVLIEAVQENVDIGSSSVLKNYTDRRHSDHDRVIGFTDNVVKIFSNDWLALAAARNIGLTLLDHFSLAKSELAKYAMGLTE